MKPLTECQREVLILAARGLSNAEIAAELFKAMDTIKTHKKRAMRSLGARNVPHAVALAYERGVLRPVYLDHPAITQTLDTMRKGEWAA